MDQGVKRIMHAGVGGQGLLLASRVLSSGLLKAGFHVKSSEVHGMAQRGGSVVTQLSYGKKVYSPISGAGAVDLLITLEKLEALRYVHFLKKNGTLLMNAREIPSLPILIGAAEYPADIEERLSRYPISLYTIDADREAEKLGNPRVMNVVLLGAMVKLAGLSELVDWPSVVAESVKPAYREINLKAFAAGQNLV